MRDRLQELVNTTNSGVLTQVLKSKVNRDLYDWVQSETSHNSELTVKERVYNIIHKPEIYCDNNNRKKFISLNKGYGFCGGLSSCKCNVEFMKSVDSNREQAEKTKRKNCLEKHGVENVMQIKDVSDRQVATRKANWTTEKSDQLKQTKTNQGFQQVCERIKDHVTPLFSADDYDGSFRKNFYEWQCVTCNEVVVDHVDYGRIPRCKICYPATVSKGEEQMVEAIGALGITNIIRNTKDIISPLELDVYLPDYNIAIEFNGVYWHSSKFRDRKYHVSKYLECKSKGVHLIQIFDDEWNTKNDIIISRLKNVLGISDKLYARKCQVKEVSPGEYKQFSIDTHLKGYASASILLGLYSDDSLVAVMSFSNSRYTKDTHELVRYSSKNTVVGGASKLFAYFVKTYKPTSVVSYADRCWSNGGLYEALGFVDATADAHNTGYWYVKNNERFHRSTFTKKRLVEMGFDKNLTESAIMENNGYHKIYDCGNSKHVWFGVY